MDSNPERSHVRSNVNRAHHLRKIAWPVASVGVHCDDDVSFRCGEALSGGDSVSFVRLKDYSRTPLHSHFRCAITRPVINHYYLGLRQSIKGNLVQYSTDAFLLIKRRNDY